ncbi:hypothetical protein NMXN1568_2194, partial [Neisseria meningitidis N1568]
MVEISQTCDIRVDPKLDTAKKNMSHTQLIILGS